MKALEIFKIIFPVGEHRLKPFLSTVPILWALLIGIQIKILPAHFCPELQTEVVRRAPMPLVVRAPGILQPKRNVVLKAEFDGPVIEKKFQEGARVAEGQFLVEIGREKVLAEFENRKNALKNAIADLARARREVKLQRTLFDHEAVSMSSVEDAQRTAMQAEDALETVQTAYDVGMKQWDKNRIVAPFAGTIIKDNILEEKEVNAGQELLTLADISGCRLRAVVDELEISRVKVGQTAEVRIQAYEDHPLQATVTRLGVAAEGNGLPEVPVYLQLNSIDGLSLLPNFTMEARIAVGVTGDILSVPLSAIDNSDGKTKVWVVNRFFRLQHRTVTLGKLSADRAEVLKGLEPGERICTAILPSLAEGMRIRVK